MITAPTGVVERGEAYTCSKTNYTKIEKPGINLRKFKLTKGAIESFVIKKKTHLLKEINGSFEHIIVIINLIN